MTRRGVSTDIILLVVAVAAFALISFEMSMRTTDNRDDARDIRRTTNSNRPGGWRAFYLLLQASGVKVERWTHRPSTWPKDADAIIVGSEYRTVSETSSVWTPGEVESALNWVDAGGTLILLSDRPDALTEALHLQQSESAGHPETQSPSQPALMLNGVTSLIVPEGVIWEESPGSAVEILRDPRSESLRPAGVVFGHGSGRVVAIASAAMADNAHLGEADNGRFIAQLVVSAGAGRSRNPGRVLFDEFHQGYDDDESLWGIIGSNGHLIVYELIVIALIAAYSAGRRFGLPQPVPEPQRVSSEYVRSLADLYRRGRAGDAALEGIYRSFRRDVCRAIGAPVEASVNDVVRQATASLANGDQAVAHRLQTWMDACEAKISGGIGAVPDVELLQIAHGLESLRKDLQLGGTDATRSD